MAKATRTNTTDDVLEYNPKNPNASLDLSEFDYNALEGDHLVKVLEFVSSLEWNKSYDFEVYPIEYKKVPRFEGVEGSPIDIYGVRFKDTKPLHTTRIEAKYANDLNGAVIKQTRQGKVIESAQFTNTNKIYLPKK